MTSTANHDHHEPGRWGTLIALDPAAPRWALDYTCPACLPDRFCPVCRWPLDSCRCCAVDGPHE